MTAIDLDEVKRIAERVRDTPDDRPPELMEMRDATHPTCLYYRFLYGLGQQRDPLAIVEVGTYCGVSAAHLAWGIQSPNRVTTIDIESRAAAHVAAINALVPLKIKAVTGDSRETLTNMPREPIYDIAYIDGLHDFDHAFPEYLLVRELVKDGGLIVYDDIKLDMETDEMRIFWDVIDDPKIDLDFLHPNVGFGVIQKDPRVSPRRDVTNDVRRRMDEASQRWHATR